MATNLFPTFLLDALAFLMVIMTNKQVNILYYLLACSSLSPLLPIYRLHTCRCQLLCGDTETNRLWLYNLDASASDQHQDQPQFFFCLWVLAVKENE